MYIFEIMTHPIKLPRYVMLAEDDDDDSMLFTEALNELKINTRLFRVKNGEELMKSLNSSESELPDILFLDINMPRKNGYECLREIKSKKHLKNLPVVVFSTSSGKEVVNKMYEAGANLYICKPNKFTQLKKIIYQAITADWFSDNTQPPLEKFLLDFK